MREQHEPRLVSVIVPTFNRADLLIETLDSVWFQTYRPMELLVVDDGSTDDTDELLSQWCAQHADDASFRVRRFRQSNRGAPVARNLGLIESRGEFIQFLDSDDAIATTKIEHQVAFMNENASVGAAYGPCWIFGASPAGVTVHHPHEADLRPDAFSQWLCGRFLPPHSVLWRRVAAFAIGPWDEELAADQDGDYTMRFLAIAPSGLGQCSSGCAFYRHHNAARVSRSADALASRIRVAEKMEHIAFDACKGDAPLELQRLQALGSRYHFLGYNNLFRDYAMARQCLHRWRELCPRGEIAGCSRAHALAIRTFGVHVTRSVASLRRMLRLLPIFGQTKTVFDSTIAMCHDRRFTHPWVRGSSIGYSRSLWMNTYSDPRQTHCE